MMDISDFFFNVNVVHGQKVKVSFDRFFQMFGEVSSRTLKGGTPQQPRSKRRSSSKEVSLSAF